MDNKFLPIGSVCTLKGRNGKVMILGLYSILFDKEIRVYDYKGCSYPEGITLSNQLFSFNHEDIEKIDFKGFSNENYENLVKELSKNLSQDTINSVKSSSGFPEFSNFVFDKDGYVIKADSTSASNPFIANVENEEKDEQTSIFKNIKFDENGTVISDGSTKEETLDITSYSEISKKEISTESTYQFDENGTVIAVNNEEAKMDTLSSDSTNKEFEFDENGTVIAVNSGSSNESNIKEDVETPAYQFDENGVVIAVNDTTIKTNSQNIDTTEKEFEFDENGIVISAKNNDSSKEEILEKESSDNETLDVEYEFDENGVIIGVKS